MKKIVFVFLMFFVSFFCFSFDFSIKEEGYEEVLSGKQQRDKIVLSSNKLYGRNFQVGRGKGNLFPGNYKPKKGDIVVIHVEGTPNREIISGKNDHEEDCSVWFALVDNSGADDDYWNILADRINYKETIPEKQKISWDMEFCLEKNSRTFAKSGGCDFIIGTSVNQRKSVKIEKFSFEFKIYRKK